MILTAPKLSSSSPRKVPFEPFSFLKIISMQQENNAVSNHLSFLQFFFYFWMFPYSFLSSPGCFTLKSWVFWVHSNYVFRSPKKLKISVFSIQVHWVFRSPEKNSRICSPEKNSLSHRQMSIRKSLHPTKKMENSSPEGSSLHTHHEKLFITQKETRTDHWGKAL